MRDARVEDVDHVSDSDNDDKDEGSPTSLEDNALTIGIFPSHQSPVYLHMSTKQDKVCFRFLRQGQCADIANIIIKYS
jgi:hypothetical protein